MSLLSRCHLIETFHDGAQIYEEPTGEENGWGYRFILRSGKVITRGLKCLDCRYIDVHEWYWQDEHGVWRDNFGFKADLIDINFIEEWL